MELLCAKSLNYLQTSTEHPEAASSALGKPVLVTPSLHSSAASYFMYSLKQEPFTNDKTGHSSVDQIKDPRHGGEWLNYFFVILMSILGLHPFMVV